MKAKVRQAVVSTLSVIIRAHLLTTGFVGGGTACGSRTLSEGRGSHANTDAFFGSVFHSESVPKLHEKGSVAIRKSPLDKSDSDSGLMNTHLRKRKKTVY